MSSREIMGAPTYIKKDWGAGPPVVLSHGGHLARIANGPSPPHAEA